MQRRAFLASLAAACAPRMTWADVGQPAFLAAGKQGEDFFLHGLSVTGNSLFQLPLPGRGHAAAAHPTRAEAVAFARRPGTFALVIDCGAGQVAHRLSPPEGLQFNGHGAYSGDGSLLMTSEVVAETSEGRIGLWDTARYSRLTDWPSHGIGPHDIKLLPDGRLAVAGLDTVGRTGQVGTWVDVCRSAAATAGGVPEGRLAAATTVVTAATAAGDSAPVGAGSATDAEGAGLTAEHP